MMSSPPSRRILVVGIVRVATALLALMGMGLSLDLLLRIPRFSDLVAFAIGLALLSGGTILEAWGTRAFWRVGRGTPHPRGPPATLVISGPYRFSRNPLYVARMAILGGAAGLAGSPGILLVDGLLFLGLQFVLVPREEARLEVRFGSAFTRYRQHVPRWLWSSSHGIPWNGQR